MMRSYYIHMGLCERKPVFGVCKQQRRRPACADAHSDQCLCYSLVGLFVCLFVFVALRPMSTAMVIAGRSVHLTTLFPGQA